MFHILLSYNIFQTCSHSREIHPGSRPWKTRPGVRAIGTARDRSLTRGCGAMVDFIGTKHAEIHVKFWGYPWGSEDLR